MPTPTKQELALQAKYAKLRKLQEEKAKQQQKGQQASAVASKANHGDAAPSVPAAAPLTAQERAKVFQAKKVPAEPKAAAAVKSAAPLDPKAAAKLLLASKTAKSGTARGLQQPTLKRPTLQRSRQQRTDSRPPSPEQPSASGVDAWPDGPAGRDGRREQRPSQGEGTEGRCRVGSRQEEGRYRRPEPRSRRDENEHSAKRARLSEENSESRGTREDGESTVFVGDLPPGFSEEEVVRLFAPLGDVQEVRVMGSQCYAFVTFKYERDASEVIRRFATHPLMAGGHQLRINRAYGQLPEWKRGPAIVREKRPGETLESYEHPKVREARLAGVALANQIHMAGMHGINLNAPPQERVLVSYDDL